ncbi:MAG: hypothetical protein RL591_1027, partial [Planctomycetota bacterium]
MDSIARAWMFSHLTSQRSARLEALGIWSLISPLQPLMKGTSRVLVLVLALLGAATFVSPSRADFVTFDVEKTTAVAGGLPVSISNVYIRFSAPSDRFIR